MTAPVDQSGQINAFLASINQTNSSASSNSGTSAASMEDTFLKLLTAQMQNQDPLNPIDNSQITSQLAQISTVSGIQTLNATVQQMMQAFTAAQQLQAGSLIGHGILASGTSLSLSGGSAVGGVQLSQPVDQLTVQIFDPSGNLVRTLSLGKQQQGVADFSWNGLTDSGVQVPDGSYTFKATAMQGGKSVSLQPLAVGVVQSVTLGSQGATLNTSGLGAVPIGSVQQVF